MKYILKEYEIYSRQSVNYDKSTVFYSSNTSDMAREIVSQIMKVKSSTDPEKYLGLSNMVGQRKKLLFQVLKDRIKKRIYNWSPRQLSQGGKEDFIKVVFQVIPTYSTACFLSSKSLCKELENIMTKSWKMGDSLVREEMVALS